MSSRWVSSALVLSGIGGLCFLLSAALYQEPQSFYTNFVLFPSLGLMALGALVNIGAIGIALANLRGATRPRALLALAIAVLVPVISIGTIQLILRA
jgi:hypothetical protein